MFISIHFYFSLCSIWPPCACITIIRCFDHLLLILNAYCRELGTESQDVDESRFINRPTAITHAVSHVRYYFLKLMASSIKSWLIVRGRPLPDSLAALSV